MTGGDSKAAIAQNSINGSCTEGDDDMAEKLNWGIIGAGGIAGTFAENLQHAELGVKCAAGSRSLAKAEAFAAEPPIGLQNIVAQMQLRLIQYPPTARSTFAKVERRTEFRAQPGR